MSKVVFKINKERQIPYSYSMRNFNKTKDKNTFSPVKDNTNFKKVTGSGVIGTSGLSPIIIYKKSLKGNQNKEKYRVKRQIKNANYISDGGLKQKIEKFNYGFGSSSPITISKNNQIKTTKNKFNKNHNLFFEENQKEKESFPRSKKYNATEKKLFSKTVRESNKRPIFPKNNEKIKNYGKTKNGFGVKYKNLNEINKDKKQEEEKNYQEEKYKYMNKLYEDGIANEIRKYQIEKKLTPKELLNEKKKVLLIHNGIELENELNNIEEEDNNSENKEEENNKNNNEHIMKSKSPSSHNLFKSQIEFNHNIISLDNQSMSPKKKIYKQSVNPFEYIEKIRKEQQKLSTNNLKPNLLKIKNNNSNSVSLNDSFRHNNNQNNNKEIKILNNNYINNKDKPIYIQRASEETVSTNDNFPYSHKKSHRSTEELKNFLKIKRLKEKENRKSKDIENNKKLFVRFKNLYNLSMKDLVEDQYKKIEPHPKGKMTKSKSNNNFNYNGNSIRKKKEINEYYYGNDHSLRNNSTLVDQSEYFLHILESQQLLVNSKLKRIENISDTESGGENTENNNSKLNISKEQINKITDKESKKSEISSNKTTNALNLSNYEDLKVKIDKTLKRVNQVFSKENLLKLKETSNSNSDTSNNIYNLNKSENNNNTTSNENIIKIKNNEIKKSNIPENIKDLKVKTHELNIDTTNVGNKITNSELNTKEKNIPSLSHTYSTNSNPNKKVEIEIEPRAVLNLVEIIKFIIQRKIFVKLYESYINHSIFQQYNIAFSYFVAICKHYPYRKIEEYANYRTYNFAFRQLFKPFIRKVFKYFLNKCYSKRKIEYFVDILSKIIKYKIMKKIYLYNELDERDNQNAFKIIIMKILNTLIKPHLKESFNTFKNKIKNIEKNNKKNLIQEYQLNQKENKLNNKNDLDNVLKIKNEMESDSEEDAKYDYLNKNHINNDKNKKDEININININDNNNIKIDNINKKNNKNFFGEENYDFDEEDNNSLHRRADVSMKMNTFMHYTSENDSKSSIDIEPNSVDNDKLHQLNKLLELRNKLLYGVGDDDLYEYGFENNGLRFKDHSLESESHKSAKSLKDYIKKKKKYLNKTNSDLDLDNSSKKSNKDKDINLNEKKENFFLVNNNKENKENKNNKEKDKIIEDKKIIKDINIEDKKDNKQKENFKDKNEDNKDIKDKIIINNNKEINKDNIKEKDINKKDSNNEEKKRNIKIEIDDIPIIKNENFNKHSISEIDISVENDKNNDDIDWEYNLSTSGNKNKEKEDRKEEKVKEDKKEEKEKKKKEIKEKEKKEEKPKKKIKEKNGDEDVFFLEDLEINTSRNNEDIEKKKKNDNNDEKKESKKSDDDYGDFDLSIDEIEKEKEKDKDKDKDKGKNKDNNIKKDLINTEEKKENFNIIYENKPDKSRNFKQDKEIKVDSNEIKEDLKNEKNEIEKKDSKEKNIKEKDSSEKDNKNQIKEKEDEKVLTKNKIEIINSIKDINKLSDDLTDEIIKDILLNEIKSNKKKLLPQKKFKFDKFDKMNNNNLNNSLTNSYGSMGDFRNNSSNLSREFSISNLSQLSLHEDLLSLNDSLMSNYSAFSVFNKTIKDKKKEHSLKLYLNKIAPKLIKIIYDEIIEKYPLIYKNISKPLKNNSDKFMISLALQDGEMLRENYKCLVNEESIEKIIDKEKILAKFSPINKYIRNKDNVTSDNFYDNMLNDCIVDTAIELIYKERLYGKNGNPLKWSSRIHELSYKFSPNEPKKFAKYICKSILRILYNRIGLISDNYDYMNTDQINMEKDRRLIKVIQKDLNDNEYQWNNLELEETQLKVEATESILDQLYNEIIEILEHIQYSRLRPELYQNKSIYACEEIPKLSFQQTTTEEMNGIRESNDNGIND